MNPTFRPATAADAGALTALLTGLSPDSAHLRFQTAIGRRPSPAIVRALLPDGVCGRALLGFVGDTLVAHGMWIRLGPSRAAEIALVVADAQQRDGIGSALADALLDDLAACGIERVEVYAGAGNRAVARMLARAAPEAEPERDGATVGYSFAVSQRRGQPTTVSSGPRRPKAA